MPINYQQALQSIREMGSQARQHDDRLNQLSEEAFAILAEWSGREAELMEKVTGALRLNDRLRSAIPVSAAVRLDHASPAPLPSSQPILIAADGSQIYPDRHAAVQFAAINCGAIRLRPGQVPQEIIQSVLLFQDALYGEDGPLNESALALRRDFAERQLLCQLAAAETPSPNPVLALMDGPIELYTQDFNARIYRDVLGQYQAVLGDLSRSGAGLAGYVDKAGSVHLIHLLEIARMGNLSAAGREHPLAPLQDAALMRRLLAPGERSATLRILSPTAKDYPAHLCPHFFYLNVGSPGRPHISRVEIPAWVAADVLMLEALHGALLAQIRQMGSAQPYPYLIHRAHEIAVVGYAEKDQLEHMIVAELRRNKAQVGQISPKQSAKNRGRIS